MVRSFLRFRVKQQARFRRLSGSNYRVPVLMSRGDFIFPLLALRSFLLASPFPFESVLARRKHEVALCYFSLFFRVFDSVVGPSGLEPPTSCLSGTRSNLLSYEPMQLCGVSHLGFFDSRSRLLCSSYRCQHRTIFPHSFP